MSESALGQTGLAPDVHGFGIAVVINTVHGDEFTIYPELESRKLGHGSQNPVGLLEVFRNAFDSALSRSNVFAIKKSLEHLVQSGRVADVLCSPADKVQTKVRVKGKANTIAFAVVNKLLGTLHPHLGEITLRFGDVGIEDPVKIRRAGAMRAVSALQQHLVNGMAIDVHVANHNTDRLIKKMNHLVGNGLVDVIRYVSARNCMHDAVTAFKVNGLRFGGNRPGKEAIAVFERTTLPLSNCHRITFAFHTAPGPEIGQGPGHHNDAKVATRVIKHPGGNPPCASILGALELYQRRHASGEQFIKTLTSLVTVDLDSGQDHCCPAKLFLISRTVSES